MELSAHFKVDSETGEITTAASFDYETTSDYTFYLVATGECRSAATLKIKI